MNAVHFLTTAARHDVASTMTLRQAAEFLFPDERSR